MEEKIDKQETAPESEDDLIAFKNFLLAPTSKALQHEIPVKHKRRKKLIKKIHHNSILEKENSLISSEQQMNDSPMWEELVVHTTDDVQQSTNEVDQNDISSESQSFEMETASNGAEKATTEIPEQRNSESTPQPQQTKESIMATDTLNELRLKILEGRKKTSLTKMAAACKVNYLTLRNIAYGASKRVTSRVENNLMTYFSGNTAAKVGVQQTKVQNTPKKIPTAEQSISPMKFYFGNSLVSELAATRARLKYLTTLEEAEREYLKAINRT